MGMIVLPERMNGDKKRNGDEKGMGIQKNGDEKEMAIRKEGQ